FTGWFESAKLLSNLISMIQLLRLDLLGRPLPRSAATAADGSAPASKTRRPAANGTHAEPASTPYAPPGDGTPWTTSDNAANEGPAGQLPANDYELPLSVLLDEQSAGSSILAGRENGGGAKPVTLNKNDLKRLAAVLGRSRSGKTTLAL